MKTLFFRLITIHNRLEQRIRLEELRASPREFLLLRMRGLRLKIKDRLSYMLTPHGMTARKL